MLKARFCTAIAAVFCVAVIVVFRDTGPFFQVQWTYLPQPTMSINTSSTKLSDPKVPINGYVLVMTYYGQQGSGMVALQSLQRWIRDVRLPMLIVEPFIQNSVVGSYRESFHALKFSDMFDLESFNRTSRSEGLAEIVPWDTYLARAPPNAILVVMKGVTETKPVPPLKVVWAAKPGSRECWTGKGSHDNIKISGRSLCYIRVLLASYAIVPPDMTKTISSAEVCNTLLSGIEPTNVTVILELWRGLWKVDDPLLPPPASCTYMHASEGLKLEYNGLVTLTSPKLKESPKLLKDIKNYQQQFLRQSSGSSYVAVMLRTEYVFIKASKIKSSTTYYNLLTVHNCLNEAVSKAMQIKEELRMQDVFVTADVGLYGSNSWNSTISDYREFGILERQVKHTVERLYSGQLKFEQWEKSFSQATGGVEDRGYIAAVQRGVASQASCLILLGGRHCFQRLALKSYEERVEPHKKCVYFVC